MQKIEKFRKGETLKYDIGPKLNLMVERLNREFRGDGRTIMVTEFGNVISIRSIGGSAPAPGGGVDTYNGYFKVIQSDTNKIKLIDGFDEDSLTCGLVQVNQFMVEVVSAELTITGDAWIYLECALTGTFATAAIVQYSAAKAYEAGKARALVSRVTLADSKITDFSRENVPPILYVIGECD